MSGHCGGLISETIPYFSSEDYQIIPLGDAESGRIPKRKWDLANGIPNSMYRLTHNYQVPHQVGRICPTQNQSTAVRTELHDSTAQVS